MVILLMVIGGHFIDSYWWLFCYKPLVVIDGYILLKVINGYCVINYFWLLYDIL
jgi:hypothetical protein